MYIKRELKHFDRDFPIVAFPVECIHHAPHWHKEFEIIYVKTGSLEIGVDSDIHLLNEGDILFIDRGHIHSFNSFNNRTAIQFLQFNFSIFGAFAVEIGNMNLCKLLRNSSEECDNTLNSERLTDIVRKEFLTIYDNWCAKEGHYKMIIMSSLLKMFWSLLSCWSPETYAEDELSKSREHLKRLEKIFSYVDENFEKSITLETIACLVNYSTYYFSRFFKESTGMSFIEYLNRVRIEKAEKMLLNTEKPISEIAFDCGFNSLSSFYRVFKEVRNTSPTEIRQKANP